MTHTEDGGASSLSIGLKKSGTFSTADLAGTWNFTALKVGDGTNANVWMYGTSVMTATGVSTDTLVADSTGATGGTQTKNFTVASDGTVTSTVAGSDFHANMNSDKNLIAGTVSDGGGSYLLLTWSQSRCSIHGRRLDWHTGWFMQLLHVTRVTAGDMLH